MTEFRSLVDLASDAALAIDSNSRVVAWNERATMLLGYSPEEAIDQPCYDVLRAVLPNGEPLCTPECEGRRCFEHQSPFGVPACRLRHKDGRVLRASISTLVAPTSAHGRASRPAVAVIFMHRRRETVSVTPHDRPMQILTFGRFGVSVKGYALPIERWHRKQALTLLKILANHHGKGVHRERLLEYLWPDADEYRGRQRLKVTIYFLRKQLRAAGMSGDIVTVSGSTCALRSDPIWMDCRAFEELFNEARRCKQSGQSSKALTRFEQAARLYRGDYLPEDPYADWCAVERERLREIYLDVLGHMIDGHLNDGGCERAAEICRRGLACEPYRESFHRALLVCLVRLGQRDRAAAHYLHCREVLKAELGVAPTPETERLYRELVLGIGPKNFRAPLQH